MTTVFSKWFPKVGIIISSILIASSLLLTHAAVAAGVAFPNTPVDCNSNAVIWCGARDISTLQSAYHTDVSVAAIYTGFFISGAMIDNMQNTAVAGQVTSSGQVIVNNKVIATNAVTAGRQDIPGSTKAMTNGVIYFVRPPSVSFVSSPLDAFVVMNNGKFLFAILASCGNPVLATAVSTPTPAPSTPTRPTHMPKTPAPSPSTPSASSSSSASSSAVATANVQVIQEAPPQPPATTSSAPVAATSLPSTGPGNVLGIFGVVVAGATLLHQLVLRRRASSIMQ